MAPRDVAAVACAALSTGAHEGRVYEVTGPEPLTVREMVHILSRALDRRVRYVPIPAVVAGIAMRRFGLSLPPVKALMETLGAWRRDEYAYVTTAVEEVAGRSPETFESWCREHRAAFAALRASGATAA